MERITLNIIPKGITPVCHASQFDIGRVIRCDIMDDLQGYVFSDETVELRVRKPDDNVVTASVDVVSGDTFVLIETTEQMTACDGVNKCELRIMKGDVRIGSLNFDMKVEVDPLKDGIESETEIHNLETQIRDMNEDMVPDMVAEEVSRQYDSENVIFDDEPTENHGDGYAVNSAGLKNYIPKNIDALDDVEIDNPTSNQALVYNPTTQKWENGEVSTVGGLNDLNDVTLENVADKQELVYDDTDEVFKNKTTRVELTQAEYNQLVADDEVLPDVDYYITDAPSMQGTSADLSYDGTTKSVYTKIEEIDTELSGKADSSDIPTKLSDLTNNLEIGKIIKGTESGSVNVASSSGTEVGSITLNKGKYVVLGGIDWVANSTGFRQVAFAATRDDSRDACVCQPTCAAPKETYQQIVSFRDIQSDNTEIKMYGYQDSGSTLGAYAFIYAIKIY